MLLRQQLRYNPNELRSSIHAFGKDVAFSVSHQQRPMATEIVNQKGLRFFSALFPVWFGGLPKMEST